MTVTMINPGGRSQLGEEGPGSTEGTTRTTRQLLAVVVEASGVRVKVTASGQVTVSTRKKKKE